MSTFIGSEHDCGDFSTITNDREMVCIKCGKVDSEGTARLRSEISPDDERISTTTDHMANQALLIVENGSVHDTTGRNTPGLCGKLGRVLKENYVTGEVVGKGSIAVVDKDGKMRAIAQIKSGWAFRQTKQQAFNISTLLGLDMLEREHFGNKVNRLYTEIQAELMPEVVALAVFMELRKHINADEKTKKGLEERYNDRLAKLRSILINKLITIESKTI